MPGTLEIMSAVRKGLDSLQLVEADADSTWTKCIKTRLCDIGRGFGYQVGSKRCGGSKPRLWRMALRRHLA